MKSNTEQLAIAKKYVGYGGSKFRKFCGLPSGSATNHSSVMAQSKRTARPLSSGV